MSSLKCRIAVFASGNGTNAEEIFKYFHQHNSVDVGLVLSNNEQAHVLQRAVNHGIPVKSFTREQWKETDQVLTWLRQANITHIVLAGFMWLIPQYLVDAFPDKIINIHPALLPKFGGKGMYGMNVHKAVKAADETETGITIHLVNEKYDEGEIILQARCAIAETDSAEQIASNVHQLEYAYYPKTIDRWINPK